MRSMHAWLSICLRACKIVPQHPHELPRESQNSPAGLVYCLSDQLSQLTSESVHHIDYQDGRHASNSSACTLALVCRVLSEMCIVQIWNVPHPPQRGSFWLGTQPRVHGGFLQSWTGNGLSQQVIQHLSAVISEAASVDDGAPHAFKVQCTRLLSFHESFLGRGQVGPFYSENRC